LKERVYFEKRIDKTLVLDIETGKLGWHDGYFNAPLLDIRKLQSLIEKRGEYFLLPDNEDIKIIYIEPYAKLKQKLIRENIFIYSLQEKLGEVKFPLKVSDFEAINRFGGLFISVVVGNETDLVYIMPNIKRYEKNTSNNIGGNIVKANGQNINYTNLSNKIDDEYIEAKIKVPKDIFKFNNHQDLMEMIGKNNELIKEFYYEINNKLNYLNNNLFNQKDNNIRQLEIEIVELNEQIGRLIQDRKILENEKGKAELIAFNNLKADLKMSILAIEKHMDLEDAIPSKIKIEKILIEVLKSIDVNQKEINKILKEENLKNKIESLADDYDSKFQSLLDIKNEFILNKIINSKGV